MKYFSLFLLLIMPVSALVAQEITGRVVNEQSQAVEGASVVLQTPDSAFVDVAITAADGTFVILSSLDKFRLVVQHLSYFHKEIPSDKCDLGTIIL